MSWIPLPIGIDNFEKIIRGNYYFVDKTLFIKELLDMKGGGKPFHPPQALREDVEHEHAPVFF